MAPALAKLDPPHSGGQDAQAEHRPAQGARHGDPGTSPGPSSPRETGVMSTQKLSHAPLQRTGRLLVVDDSPVERALAATMLERAGFDVTLATDGAEAVRIIRDARQPFDVVVMDVSMPVVDGLSATRAIRALPGDRAQVPIIALTANDDDDDRARCFAAGMNAHTSKPISLPTLLATMRAHLRVV